MPNFGTVYGYGYQVPTLATLEPTEGGAGIPATPATPTAAMMPQTIRVSYPVVPELYHCEPVRRCGDQLQVSDRPVPELVIGTKPRPSGLGSRCEDYSAPDMALHYQDSQTGAPEPRDRGPNLATSPERKQQTCDPLANTAMNPRQSIQGTPHSMGATRQQLADAVTHATGDAGHWLACNLYEIPSGFGPETV
ncbi:hypothetical protein ON010_g14090 [Phytophthora cinnamomi]|nr:hypothetical protein ON010_g14090 [Phytophthora cinnamomi]